MPPDCARVDGRRDDRAERQLQRDAIMESANAVDRRDRHGAGRMECVVGTEAEADCDEIFTCH